ncbi:MAG: hypothetical protein ACRC9N_02510 [Aeromonas sp.]
MLNLHHYQHLTPTELTTAIDQLNHNSALKIMAMLASQAKGSRHRQAKALKLLRRIKKAHTTGRIPFELTITGCRIDRGSHQTDRYYYDQTLLTQDWQQYDTEEDAWYFGIWINPKKRETFTYLEGDTHHVIAPNIEAFQAELARLYQHYPQAPAFISIDPQAGVMTPHFETKPEV